MALAVTLSALLVTPATAQAKIPIVGEIPVVGPVVEGVAGAGEALWNPAEAVMSAFLKVLQAIFGGVEAHLITEVVVGLLAVPNFSSGHVAGLEHTTVAISAGMLSAVLTLSILRYYIAGLSDSGSGGFEALQGLVRVIGAVGFIVLWPGIFNELLEIPSAFNHALLGSTSVQHNVALLFDAALAIGAGAFAIGTGLGLIFVILIGFISAIVFLALLWMKVLLSVMLMFLYVSMPLCVVLWPVPELSWLAASAMKALSIAVIVPSVWAILFALSAAVNADVLTLAPSHSVIDTVIIRPLAGITLMLLCITIPRFLMRTAMIGPQGQSGGWRVWRTVTFGMFAARAAAGAGQAVASAAVEGHAGAARMIDSLPSPIRPPSAPGAGNLASRLVFGRSGFAEEQKGSGKGSGAGKPGRGSPQEWGADQPAADTASGSSGGAGSQTTPAQAGSQSAGEESGGRVASQREIVDAAGGGMHADAQSRPTSSAQVARAMAALPEKAQRQIADAHASEPLKLRDAIAHQVDSGAWNAQQRDALWTIGSSRGKEAEEGIQQAIGRLNETGQPAASARAAGEPSASGARAPAAASRPAGAAPPPGASPTTPDSSPPSGSRSLGADLREQPAPGRKDTSTSAGDGGLADPEPFLD